MYINRVLYFYNQSVAKSLFANTSKTIITKATYMSEHANVSVILHMCPIHTVCNGNILNVLPTFIATVIDVRAAKIHGRQHLYTKPNTNHAL